MAISKVGVVGGGLMGHGITQICAQADWDVVVREVAAAWSITASDDVLVAKNASSVTIGSTAAHISSFIPRSSVIASMTRSQSASCP